MESKPGTYALVLKCSTSRQIAVGCRGTLCLRPGYYLYVGSAFGPGGVLARVARHRRDDKAKRWHIDYLREYATPLCCWYSHHPQRLEHRWAKIFSGADGLSAIEGFGCSDCTCSAHLFFSEHLPDMDGLLRRNSPESPSAQCELYS